MQISRRRILMAGAAAAALTTAGRSLAGPLPPPEDQLAALEDRYNAKVGCYGRNLGSGRTVAYRADDLFATCSAFKAYVAGAILMKDQRGELKLADEVYIDPAFFVPVASPITEPHLRGWLPFTDLCAAAVRQSDNTATNLMVEVLGGPQAVTDFARSVGDDRIWMVRWELELNSAYPGDPRDTSTPRSMSNGFATMLTGDVFDDAHRAQLNEWMRTIVTGDTRIRAGLPPGWSVADKTGAGDYASTNDLGVAFGPNGEQVQLGVMTRTRSEDPKAPALNELIADATRVVLPYLLV